MYKTLVVYVDNAVEAIANHRKLLGLPPIRIDELKFGIDEVMQIVNVLDAQLLTGKQATLPNLLTTMNQGWEIVWLITHGSEEGWYLNDGLVNASETTALMRSSGTYLTVMNTCSSKAVAEKIASELGTAFVCTLSEVPDRTAFIMGVIMAQKLAAGMDYVEAYEAAKPGQNSTYELIRARRPMPSNERDRPTPPPVPPGGMPDADTLLLFMRSVQELDMIVNGSSRLGLPALKDTTRTLQTEISNLQRSITSLEKTITEEITVIKGSMANIEARQRGRNRLIVGMAITLAIMIVIIGIMTAREWGGLDYASLILAALSIR